MDRYQINLYELNLYIKQLYNWRTFIIILFWIILVVFMHTYLTENKIEKYSFKFLHRSRNLSHYLKPFKKTALVNIRQPWKCRYKIKVPVIYFVTSAPGNRIQRNAIRDTWGRFAQVPPIFFVGITKNHKEMILLKNEALLYQDIIIEDFIDVYENLTIKTGFMLKHFHEICTNARYLMKADDDTYVNPMIVEEILNKLNETVLVGMIRNKSIPVRNKSLKYYNPSWIYPKEIYPQYLDGNAYAIPQSAIIPIYNAALTLPMVHLEDVMYTGIIANEYLNYTLINDRRFREKRPYITNFCLYRKFASVHKIMPFEQLRIWERRNTDCDTYFNQILLKIYNIIYL